MRMGFILLLACCRLGEHTNTDHQVSAKVTCKQTRVNTWHRRFTYESDSGPKCHSLCLTGCTCTLDPNTVITSNCSNGRVYQSVIPYPSNMTYLNWNDSVIHGIRPQAFITIAKSLKVLLLSNVSLQYLQPGAFNGLLFLEILFVTNNKISNIATDTFEGLSSLINLDLSNNCLTGIGTSAFNELSSLKTLYLLENGIIDIATNAFRRLDSLNGLDLTNNYLTEISTGTFNELSSLKWLFLSNNYLSDIAIGAFNGLNLLTYLQLSNNYLTEILTGIFNGLTSLNELHLSGNYLSNIATDPLNGLSSLRFLFLSNNFLTDIAIGAFKGTSLLRLYLSNNSLTDKATNAFSGLSLLSSLDLSHNSLTEIPRVLDDMTNLSMVDLSYNQITDVSFRKVTLLHILDLSNNNITEISPGSFRRLFISVLDESYSPIIEAPRLSLSHNSLSMLHPDTFQNKTQLQILDLNHNHLQFLPQRILYNVRNLRHLDLSDNNLVHLPAGLLHQCIHLEKLDLRNNPLWLVTSDTFNELNTTIKVFVSEPSTCCFMEANCIYTKTKSPFLTCKRLLPYYGLRVAIWFVCGLAILGNILVWYYKYRQKQQGSKIQFLLITSLSISDFCMSVYLLTLISSDLYYGVYFPSFSESWRSSGLCRTVGALSVFSSEASTFFITLLTIDRLMGVKYTFSAIRFGVRLARVMVAVIWLVALIIGIATFALSQGSIDVYAVSEMCVGLPIARYPQHTVNETSLTQFSTLKDEHVTSSDSFTVYTGSRAAMYFP